MQLYCPACQAAFPSVARCPRCGGLLLLPHEISPDAPHRQSEMPPRPARPTAGGRVALGTVLALGLYLGVRKLVMGAVLAIEPAPRSWWLSLSGLVAVHATQAIAVMFGAMIAASARPAGYALGLCVGAVCGALFLGFELVAGAPTHHLVLYLQPPVLVLLGLVAGVVGTRVWGPAPELNIPVPHPSKLSSLQLGVPDATEHGRPTNWVRILIGATIMVVGMTVVDDVRLGMQRYSGGLLQVESLSQGRFITWQLATLVVLLGGVTAGASTGAGLRHGVVAGVIAGVAILGICVKSGNAVPPIEYWLEWIAMDGYALTAGPAILAIVGSIVVVALLGGWLGSTLFLPLAPPQMRRRLRRGLD